MRRVLFALLLVLALTIPASARQASGIFLTPEQPRGAWDGAHLAVGAGQLVPACAAAMCETVAIRIDFPTESMIAALSVVVSWPSADDDYDIYLYDASGFLVTSASTRDANYEKFGVDTIKPGDYSLVVAPIFVIDSAHTGAISLDVLQ